MKRPVVGPCVSGPRKLGNPSSRLSLTVTDASDVYGSVDLYVGDDGLIYS
jgi:hypothetical protein